HLRVLCPRALVVFFCVFFLLHVAASPVIYTLSLHDALPITLHSPLTGRNPIGIDRILSGSGSDDVDDPAPLAGAELHGAGSQSEEGVVSSTADVGSGVELGSALADEDLAGLDGLAAEALDAEVLRV